MVVHKKQEWYVQEEPTASPAPKKPIQKADKRLRAKCLMLVAVVAIMAIITTMQSAAIVQTGYDLVKLKGQVAKVEKDNELLRLDIAKLKSPQRIEEIATKELGMIVPQNAYYASAVLPAQGVPTTDPVTAKQASTAERILSITKVNKVEASNGR